MELWSLTRYSGVLTGGGALPAKRALTAGRTIYSGRGGWTLALVVPMLVLMFGVQQALAEVIREALDPKKFGTLDQARTNCPKDNCGPTAAVNSFVYLQNMFPDIYKIPLVPAGKDMDVNVANKLNGKDFMNVVEGGTSIGDFILGKKAYIEQQDKGATTYKAQMKDPWDAPGHPGATKPSFVEDNTKPTVKFIADELKAKEDVEISLQPFKGGLGHFVTLTDITFSTDDPAARGEGKISFVDPNGSRRPPGEKVSTSKITREAGADKSIGTDYVLDGAVTRIVGVIAESPVPEPSTLLLLGSGMAGLALLRKRKFRERRPDGPLQRHRPVLGPGRRESGIPERGMR